MKGSMKMSKIPPLGDKEVVSIDIDDILTGLGTGARISIIDEYSCNCGHIQGIENKGKICAKCKSKCHAK